MSGELDTRPDLVEQIRELRDKIRDLESRVNGDESGFDLSDLNDVRVDSMVDAGVTLVDGSALVYRASDDIWIAGPASGGLPIINDDGTYTQTIEDSSGRLRLKNLQNSGSVALGDLILDTDGSVYLESRGVEAVVSAPSGADARIQSGAHTYVKANEDTGVLMEAFLAIQGLAAGVDDGSWSAPTFYIEGAGGTCQTIFAIKTPTISGDLNAGQFGFWLDDTIGATKVMFKAKDSGGTVRTGSVALT